MLLMEAEQLRQMIVEAREDGILKRFTPVLLKDWAKLKPKMLSVSGPILEIVKATNSENEILAAKEAQKSTSFEPGRDEPWDTMVIEATIRYIVSNDPDPKKTFSTWIVTMFSRGFFLLEDMPRVIDGLAVYVDAKKAHHIERSHDLGTVKTLNDFYDLIGPFRGDSDTGEIIDRSYEAEMYKQAKLLLDSADYKVLCPLTQEAAQWFGRHTEWCTAWGGKYGKNQSRSCMYDRYNDAPLYIIQRKADGVIWQFSFEHGQFMDVEDREINVGAWMTKNPEAVTAIGVDNFAKMIGRHGVKLKNFDAAQVEQIETEHLVKLIDTKADLASIPAAKRDTVEFFNALVRYWEKMQVGRGTYTEGAERKNLGPVLLHFAKVIPDDVVMTAMERIPQFFIELPARFHTDANKVRVAENMSASNFKSWIPQPWTDDLSQTYYDKLVPTGAVRVSQVEDKFLTDSLIESGCITFPNEIGQPNIRPRVTEAMMVSIIMSTSHIEDAGAQVDEAFETPKIAAAFYERAKEHPKWEEALKGVSNLPYKMWPWRNTAICMGAAQYLTCEYKDLPPAFHDTPKFTEMWVTENSDNFVTLPPVQQTEELFLHAIRNPDESRKNKFVLGSARLRGLLLADHDKTVRQEWVDSVFIKAFKTSETISEKKRLWSLLPVDFRSPEMIVTISNAGLLSFDDPSFNEKTATPVAIARTSRAAIKALRVEWRDETNRNYKPEPKAAAKKEYLQGLKRYWKSMPEIARTEAALMGFVDEKLEDMVLGAPENLRTAEVLTRWLSVRERYASSWGFGHRSSGGDLPTLEKTEIFKAFPKSSWTAENMALAVDHSLIAKVPDDLISDDVVVKQICNYNSRDTVNWERVTPSVVRKALEEGGPSIIHAPWPVAVLADEETSWAFLSLEHSSYNIYAHYIRDAYAKPGARANWTQRCYNQAMARNLIDLADVPSQFRNDDADVKAIKKRPANIETIEDRVGWLNSHIPNDNFYALMIYGLMNTPDGWIEVTPKVEGPDGFYTVVPNREGKKVVFFFNREHQVVNIMRYQVKFGTEGYSDHGFHIQPKSSNEDQAKGMLPVRKTLAQAINTLRCGTANLGGGSWLSDTLGIWNQSDSLNVLLTEELPRSTINSITYTTTKAHWGHKRAHVYIGDSLEEIAWVKYEQHGMNHRFEDGGIRTDPGNLLAHANDMATMMAELDLPAGSGQKFKDSDFYEKLGIRGTGGFVWGAYLVEKVMSVGKLSVWTGMSRVAVAHSKLGVLAVGKITKDGSFVSSENITTAGRSLPYATLEAVFQAMKGKISL